MTRGIAPLLLGYQAFDRNIRIAGVILNNLGGARHEAKLRAVIEHYTDMTVLGAVHADDRLAIVERHLGLMPSNEAGQAERQIATIGEAIARQVDLDRVIEVARSARPLTGGQGEGVEPVSIPVDIHDAPSEGSTDPEPLRLGVAMDRAFGFYYADDLAALEKAGARIVPIDTLDAPCLPAVDALFIGGGFPEMFAPELAANVALRASIRDAVEGGMPVYAECGGLMYLARSLQLEDGTRHEMVGALPADVVMHRRPVGRGYVELLETASAPWPLDAGEPKTVKAHEFHYSSLENLDADVRFAYRVTRGHGIDGRHDGLVWRNVLASYTHLRSVGSCHWTNRFIAFVRGLRAPRSRPGRRAAAVTS